MTMVIPDNFDIIEEIRTNNERNAGRKKKYFSDGERIQAQKDSYIKYYAKKKLKENPCGILSKKELMIFYQTYKPLVDKLIALDLLQ